MNSKKFDDYNDYHDRGIMKWQTAFALGELVSAIDKGDQEAESSLKKLPQQSQQEIELLLEKSIKCNQPIEVQLNTLDDFGRVKRPLFGNFRGMIEMDTAQIGEHYVKFCDIRHIKIHDFRKWSDVSNDNESKSMMGNISTDEDSLGNFEEDFWIE